MSISYHFINKALDSAEAKVAAVAHISTHFLHETLKQIANRNRERETMKLTTVALAGQADAKLTTDLSLAAATELKQTQLKSNSFEPAKKSLQFQPRPAFMRGNENDEQPKLTNAPRAHS